jgi:hypothetical protein
MRQARQCAVGLCQIIMTLQWNNCASFYVVTTAIQIISRTYRTALLEQSSLSFHCHICCFISRSEVKFPCGTTVGEVWNSTHVVLIVKWVFILKMVLFRQVLRRNINNVNCWWEKCVIFNTVQKNILLFYNSVSQCDISINISVLNNFWYGIWGADSGEKFYKTSAHT